MEYVLASLQSELNALVREHTWEWDKRNPKTGDQYYKLHWRMEMDNKGSKQNIESFVNRLSKDFNKRHKD